ncbi:MAG: hypothetical protein L0G94_06595 [Brachybacterium sp.]|uniref:hypothetical protein n=1 Tax=Brachybacterium sp. TaxID=1891286 RepID=UPI0026491C7A|nr:hypothetical protein [Brachybacterium sp.]MDN5686343.1 hypothetical protein [Brachybacterium sp.]
METTSLLLRAPSANLVYTAAAGPLARAEARWVLGADLGTAPEVRERRVGGMDALEIHASEVASDQGARLLGSRSATLGVLDLVEDDPETPVLRPRNPPDLFRHPADLETILKCPGKTNEQFTALLVNLAADRQTLRAGRGQSLTMLGCDTTRLGELLPARSVDALVADLPYGVQHGARADGTWRRTLREVLRSAADGWRRLLRDGGGFVLAVNRRTLDHDAADEVLAAAGFRILSRDGAFRHHVDRSIDRDVLLAVPTDHPQLEQLSALDADQETDRP